MRCKCISTSEARCLKILHLFFGEIGWGVAESEPQTSPRTVYISVSMLCMKRIKKCGNISAHLLNTCMLTAISTQSSYKCSVGTFIQAFPIIEHEICVTYGADFSAFTHCTVTARAWGTFMCICISKFSTKNQWSTAFSAYRCHTETWKYAVQATTGKRHHINLKSSQAVA